MNKPLFYSLKALLKQKGYSVSDDYIWSAVEYIEIFSEGYTIFDWLRDTEANYPEDLKGGDD